MIKFQHFLPWRQSSPDRILPLRQALAGAECSLSDPQIVSRGLGGDRGRVAQWREKTEPRSRPLTFQTRADW